MFARAAGAIAMPDTGISLEFPTDWLRDCLDQTGSFLLRVLEHSSKAGGPVWHVSSIATIKMIANDDTPSLEY